MLRAEHLDPQCPLSKLSHPSAAGGPTIPLHRIAQAVIDRLRIDQSIHEHLAVADRQVEALMFIDGTALASAAGRRRCFRKFLDKSVSGRMSSFWLASSRQSNIPIPMFPLAPLPRFGHQCVHEKAPGSSVTRLTTSTGQRPASAEQDRACAFRRTTTGSP